MKDNILRRHGKEMTWAIKAGCMGKPERQAAEHLLSFFPDISLTIEDYLRERNEQQDRAWPFVKALPGAIRLVQHLKAHGIPIAVATGTRREKLNLKAQNLDQLFGCFEGKVVCSDDGLFDKTRGKPCPDIFLVAASKMLGREVGIAESNEASTDEKVERSKGLVFEDATSGVEAAKRAGMNVVWVADENLLEVGGPMSYVADETLRSLESFDPTKWGLPPYPES